jgi:hypothetical protein
MTVRWTEGHVHLAMREHFRSTGWTLIAGEYPGGSDHELYPLNVVDPKLARDRSPDPRRHSLGELIPDLVALRGSHLAICEAKPKYDEGDRRKLVVLLTQRRTDLDAALEKFARERGAPSVLPVARLTIWPVLVFPAFVSAPAPEDGLSYLRVADLKTSAFEGPLAEVGKP